MRDFLLAESRQSSFAFKSAEEGVVEALLCREESSVELVFVVLVDPLPLVESQPRLHKVAPHSAAFAECQAQTRVTGVTQIGTPYWKLRWLSENLEKRPTSPLE